MLEIVVSSGLGSLTWFRSSAGRSRKPSVFLGGGGEAISCDISSSEEKIESMFLI